MLVIVNCDDLKIPELQTKLDIALNALRYYANSNYTKEYSKDESTESN